MGSECSYDRGLFDGSIGGFLFEKSSEFVVERLLGAGIAYTEDNINFISDFWNLGCESKVFDAELFTIVKAFKLIEIKSHKRENSLKEI
ncbi:hypothetical protein BDBG_02979 [Blastomyces gilchristii SLH14081]|uniref:Uncharacterized protein n=1 Tax=Blastomyces gilchristii (strain SLH14081) TaxID=559298 RepID=A0A179UI70_BLAGS|nr:uncharacterized protein BDBG_02979 [Blastomyces gilchristii SLH14081]OAT06837.1 hypothetical protein BDBG_02979 [Blastomyces gilchristii SLH14081]